MSDNITCPKCQSTDLRQVTPVADNGKAAYRCNTCRRFFAAGPATTYPSMTETLRTAADLVADADAARNWRTLLRLLADYDLTAKTPEHIVTDLLLGSGETAANPAHVVRLDNAVLWHDDATRDQGRLIAIIQDADMVAEVGITTRGAFTISLTDGRIYIFQTTPPIANPLHALPLATPAAHPTAHPTDRIK
jgi:hypothetical protein